MDLIHSGRFPVGSPLFSDPKSKIDMMLYVLICLCLALSGVAGLQFLYMFYLERMDAERRNRLHELERQIKHLSHRLADARREIAAKEKIIESFYEEYGDEAWADVMEEQ